MKSDNIFKTLFSNTIVIFILIVILMLIITYLCFQKIETYKFLVVLNVIGAIIIFVLLSLNDHFKSTSGYDILPEEKVVGGIDENKIKYFNNIFDGGKPTSTDSSLPDDTVKGDTMDDVDKQIEDIIKELQ